MISTHSLPIRPACRVVVDNDWAGDPDGLVALAHHLLSPSNVVRAVTSSILNPAFGPVAGTAARGAALATALIDLVGVEVSGGVHAGREGVFDDTHVENPAAAAIIREARREDPLPLYVVCAGPLTNIADALLAFPSLADEVTLVWVGGSTENGVWEYNRATDEAAARSVAASTMPVIQYPLEAYRRATISVAELEQELGSCGDVGAWLWRRFVELPLPASISPGEIWAMGDSLPLLITALGRSTFEDTPTAAGIRTIDPNDLRLLIGDLCAKLRGHARSHRAAGLSS